jgi:DNA modification methylase
MNYLRDLQVRQMPVASLTPHASNPRVHSPKQIRQIAESIKEFGFSNPILTDSNGGVIAGHGRLEAAKLLGLEMVPTIPLAELSEAQKRAYILADNRIAEKAGWDQELLALELKYIADLDVEFDLRVTGFETAEIDLLINPLNSATGEQDGDEFHDVDRAQPTVSQLGDLWRLDEHRLLCGDATESSSFAQLLDGRRAQMVFTDPPYNVPISGNVCGLGNVQHRDFVMASGEMTEAYFSGFLEKNFRLLVQNSKEGSIHFICMDWRHVYELVTAGRNVYTELKALCVWNKTNGGMGAFYRSKHELIFVFKNGSAAHVNNVQLGRFGRNRTNVWDYAGVNTFREGRLEDLAAHPTVKPVSMIADAILDCSKRGAIVLDCFGGSGTTLIAAEKTGRRAAVMEIDGAYVDVAIRRYEKATGKRAMHAASGMTFADVEHERLGEKNGNNGNDKGGGHA